MENQELRERGIGFSYQIYRTKRDAEETVKSLTGLPIREMRGEEKRRVGVLTNYKARKGPVCSHTRRHAAPRAFY